MRRSVGNLQSASARRDVTATAQAALVTEQADAGSNALVFPDSAGGFHDDHKVRRRMWAPLLTAAELSHHRLHSLRHMFATLHLQAVAVGERAARPASRTRAA